MAEPVISATAHDEAAPRAGCAHPALNVVLVNAMGDAALAITEQRFYRLLQAVFPDRKIALRCTTLPSIARGEMAAARIARHYLTREQWAETPSDLVIFSGAEPYAADLHAEIFWPDLVQLFDEVMAAGKPALYSCLAAHAAALHFGGVQRRRLARKISGVFWHGLAAPHRLTAAAPRGYLVAHSRWNALDEDDLVRAGCAVLARGPDTGVDAFVLDRGAPHVCLQGHPEYEISALYGEFRRDQRRFEAGLLGAPPDPPTLQEAPPGGGEAVDFCRSALRTMLVRQAGEAQR